MAAVSDADYKPCPHCGRALHKWTRNRHIAACPQRPEIAAAMREALAGADGYAATPDEYAARTAGTDLPTVSTLMNHFRAWRAATAHFGLRSRIAVGADRPCPHCGREFAHLGHHVTRCPLRPEIADALRAALTSVEDGCMASRDEYDALRAPGLPNPNALSVLFGSWPAVGAHFGLQERPAELVNKRRSAGVSRGWAARREGGSGSPQDDPLLVGAVRVTWDYGDGDGLIAYGARPLPGGGTVYMLR